MAAEIDSELTIERLRASRPDYDVDMKYINCDIYNSHLACWMGTCFAKMQRLQMDRMMSLIGLPDRKACIDWLGQHSERDATVGELLVSEALVTGKWKELPDELQDKYHARKKELMAGKTITCKPFGHKFGKLLGATVRWNMETDKIDVVEWLE